MMIEDLRQTLGFEGLDQVDGFLEARGVYQDYTFEEINRQVETLATLGLLKANSAGRIGLRAAA